jgi:two-component system, NtrC family, sensor kinase
MFQELKFQLSTAILTILTLAAGVCAVVNLGEQYHFHLPDDGVIWADRSGGVQAVHVPTGTSGARAGIREGDWLTDISGVAIENSLDVAKALAGVGPWGEATYVVVRNGVEVTIKKVIVAEAPVDLAVKCQYAVGLAYLIIGLFVYFRRSNAQKSRHFYVFCLVSFVFFCFHYTGKLNTFDKVIY